MCIVKFIVKFKKQFCGILISPQCTGYTSLRIMQPLRCSKHHCTFSTSSALQVQVQAI